MNCTFQLSQLIQLTLQLSQLIQLTVQLIQLIELILNLANSSNLQLDELPKFELYPQLG